MSQSCNDGLEMLKRRNACAKLLFCLYKPIIVCRFRCLSPSSLLTLTWVVIRKFCYHGKVTSHFSLFDSLYIRLQILLNLENWNCYNVNGKLPSTYLLYTIGLSRSIYQSQYGRSAGLLEPEKKKTLFINLPAIFIFISVTHSSKARLKRCALTVPS